MLESKPYTPKKPLPAKVSNFLVDFLTFLKCNQAADVFFAKSYLHLKLVTFDLSIGEKKRKTPFDRSPTYATSCTNLKTQTSSLLVKN